MLGERSIPFVVAEQNREIVGRLRLWNIPAVSGDASDPGVLIQAHVARADVLVLAAPEALQVRKIVEVARALNPGIEILLRTHSDDEAALFERERLGSVFLPERELAIAMAQRILEQRVEREPDSEAAVARLVGKR